MKPELWVHDAISGNERAQVFPLESGARWSTNMGGTGDCSWSFRIDDPETGMSGDRVRELFLPNARMLSLRLGDEVLAWKVEGWDYSDDNKTVTVTGVELIRTESKMRMTYGLSLYEFGTLTVTNRSYSGAVRAIIFQLTQRSPEWNYPIDLPADGAGGFSQTWEYWKKFTIEDLLVQIEQEGVEIFFRPYLTSGRQLRFETIVGPKITIGQSAFHLQAEDSPLSGVHYRVDGSEQLTGVQGLGEGTGQDQEVAYTPNAGPFTIPIRDVKVSYADLKGARLQAAANASLEENRNLTVQWTVDTFTASDEYPPLHALTGRGWKLQSQGHPIYPDGVHTVRVIAASGSFGMQIKTEVQA